MARIVARTIEIQKLCLEHGIRTNAYALAEAAGVSYELVRRMMNGDPPSEKTISAVMSLFGRPFDELFELTGDRAPAR